MIVSDRCRVHLLAIVSTVYVAQVCHFITEDDSAVHIMHTVLS